MTIEKVQSMLRSQPFRRFKLVLLDGREFRVNHPEFLHMAPNDRAVIYFEPGQNDSYFTIIDLFHVATLEPLNGFPGTKSKRSRGRKKS